ncbi:hypothetical protein RI367_002831 [Sorochytrium milnesiophthora]
MAGGMWLAAKPNRRDIGQLQPSTAFPVEKARINKLVQVLAKGDRQPKQAIPLNQRWLTRHNPFSSVDADAINTAFTLNTQVWTDFAVHLAQELSNVSAVREVEDAVSSLLNGDATFTKTVSSVVQTLFNAEAWSLIGILVADTRAQLRYIYLVVEQLRLTDAGLMSSTEIPLFTDVQPLLYIAGCIRHAMPFRQDALKLIVRVLADSNGGILSQQDAERLGTQDADSSECAWVLAGKQVQIFFCLRGDELLQELVSEQSPLSQIAKQAIEVCVQHHRQRMPRRDSKNCLAQE